MNVIVKYPNDYGGYLYFPHHCISIVDSMMWQNELWSPRHGGDSVFIDALSLSVTPATNAAYIDFNILRCLETVVIKHSARMASKLLIAQHSLYVTHIEGEKQTWERLSARWQLIAVMSYLSVGQISFTPKCKRHQQWTEWQQSSSDLLCVQVTPCACVWC